MRFISNSKKDQRITAPINSIEYSKAEKTIIKLIQKEFFNKDETKEALKTLNIYEDTENIFRLKTKILYREDSEDFKTPYVLPSEHEVVKRLIYFYHVKNGHVGTQILLNLLREKFWILKGRRTVRSVLSKCVVCRRYSGKNLEATTAPLPEDRVCNAAVFEITGIDLAGPLYLRNQDKI